MANGRYILSVDTKMGDTSGLKQLKTELMQLESFLSSNKQKGRLGYAGKFQIGETIKDVQQLRAILNSSWDTKLNQLNLNKLNTEITSAYGSVEKLKKSMENGYNAGATAYNKFANQVLGTNLQLKESNKLLDEMATSFKNTVKWGVSSSIFNTMTGAIQKAWGYTQDLDESLNSIRIVSEKTTEQMAQFAVEANKAAKALGSTTLDYTDASLIYFQQGLSDQAVAARTETTLKMANVLGTHADEVSEYMTAIWNNFDNGAHSLEYYADVITKLGAATASSSEEIAAGLEKFAAVSDTIGLSYEYATSALATVTATTRQSADVVGTAFKTLFSRIQGLSLGETLDDGTTLNKYSEALNAVGISIKEQNGELKDMDKILDEMGSVWSNLSKDQKVALAQTVAGVRQYNQLMSLMDNWDFFEENLATANDAVGTLSRQQEIYLDSMEAHLNKFQTELEKTYDLIADESFIKGIADVGTEVLSGFNSLLTGLNGGLNSLLNMGAGVVNLFDNQIATAINRQVINSEGFKKNLEGAALGAAIIQNGAAVINPNYTGGTEHAQQQQKDLDERMQQYDRILQLKKNISNEEANSLIQQQNVIAKLQEEIVKVDEYETTLKQLGLITEENSDDFNAMHVSQQQIDKEMKKAQMQYIKATESIKEYTAAIEVYNKKVEEKKVTTQDSGFLLEELKEPLNNLGKIKPKAAKRIENKIERDKTALDESDIKTLLAEQNKILDEQGKKVNLASKAKGQMIRLNEKDKELLQEQLDLEKEKLKTELDQFERQKILQQGISGIASIVQSTTAVYGVFKTVTNDSLEPMEKFNAILMTSLTLIPSLVTAFASMNKLLPALAIALGVQGTAAEISAMGFGKMTKAILTTQKSIFGLKMAMWEITLIVAMVVAAIAMIAAMVDTCTKSYNKTAIAAEEANAQLEVLTDGYNKCKEAVSAFNAELSRYTDGMKGISQLIEGTEQFNEAVEKSNELAQNLIDKYDLIAGQDYTIDSNGLIHIDTDKDSTLATREQELANQELLAESQMLAGQYKAARLTLDAQQLEYQRETGIDRDSEIEQQNRQRAKDVAINIPGVDLLMGIGAQIGVATSEHRGYNIDKNEIDELTRVLTESAEGYEHILSQSEEEVRQWILNNDNLSASVKEDVEHIVKEKDALISLIATTEDLNNTFRQVTEGLMINHIRSSKLLSGQIEDLSGGNAGTQALIEKALAASENSQILARTEQTSLDFAKNRAVNVKSNNDLEEFITNNNLTGVASDITDMNDEKTAKMYLKYVMGYTDEDIANIKIDNQSGKTSATWSKGYTDSKGTSHESGSQIYSELNDEEARSTIAYQVWAKQILKANNETAEILLQSNMDAIKNMAQSTVGATSKYGVDFSNVILNSMAGRQDGQNSVLDFSSMFSELTDAEIDELINMDSEQLAKTMGLSEDDFYDLGYEGAIAFEKAFDEGIIAKRKTAVTNILDLVTAYGIGGDQLSESSLNSLTDSLFKIPTEDLEALQKVPLAFQQLDFSNASLETTSEQLAFMAKQAKKAMNEGWALTAAQKELAEELEVSEKAIKLWSKDLVKNNKYLEENEEAAADTILANAKMNRGINTLAEGWEDWNKVLKDCNKDSIEYWQTLADLQSALEDVFGITVSPEFLQNEEHLRQLGELAKGNTQSFEELRDAAMVDYVTHLDIIAPDQATVDGIRNQLLDMVNDVQSQSTIEFGAELDTAYVDQLNEMLRNGQITEQQMNEVLGGIGYHPNVRYEKKMGPETRTEHTIKGKIGNLEVPIASYVDVSRSEVQYPVIEGGSSTDGSSTGTAPTYIGRPKTSGINYSNGAGRAAKSGSKKDPDSMDAVEEELDRYHDINIILQQIETDLERLDKQKEKLFGSDLVENLNQQLKVLDRQIDATNKKIEIAKGEAAELRGELAGYGAKFNGDGTLANYAEIYTAQLNYVNSLIARYNSMSATQQEGFKDTVETAKENFDKFVESIERYDALIAEEIPGLQDEIQDAINEQIEIQIEKFNMEIEIRLNLEEAQKEWNDFKKRIIDGVEEDDILGNAKADVQNYGIYYDKQGTGVIQKETEHLYELLDQLRQMDETGTSSYYGDNRAQAMEDLRTYTEALMSSMEELDELIKQIEESYVNLMDEAQEKFDQQIENFEFITENLEHNIKLVELMKGTEQFSGIDTYKLMDDYYSKQQENYQQQIQFQASQVQFWKEQMDGAEYASDEWESAREKWMAATSELNSLIETSIENLQTKYLNTIDAIFDEMNKGVTGGLGLDYVSEEWDLINKNAEQYLDTINSAYGIQKLQDKYLDAIEGTDSLSAQQKLNKLMEQELAVLRNKDKLTEYDLERAEKKYEIALKQIALEEAQQNKSQLRLRRDSQGNYTYQYVADDDEVSKLKQEIDDLYNALYNFDLNRYKENLDQAYSMWEEMQSKIYDIYQDTTLSEEQRNQKIALLQEQYGELINGIVAENEVIRLNLQESTYIELDRMYGENITHFENMTLAQQELVYLLAGDSVAAYEAMSQAQQAIIADLCGFTLAEFTALSEEEQRIYLDLVQGYQNLADSEKDILEGQIVPQWNSGVQNMVTTITAQGGLLPTCQDAFDKMQQAVKDLGAAIDTTLANAGKDFEDLTSVQDDTILTTQNMITAMGDLTTAYGNQLTECRKVIDGLKDLQREYGNAEVAAKNAAKAANEYQIAANKKAANDATVNSPSSNTQPASNTPATTSTPQHTGPQGNGNPDIGDTVTYTGGYYYTSSNGGSKGKRGIGKQVRITQIAPGARYPIHVYSTDSAYGWLTKEQLSGYDTGGYTGEWDSSGRLALLHQKELVLNATDTQNMLAAVEIIRSITDSIGSNMLSRLASLNASAAGFNSSNTETIEQNVHIEANFPNVKDSKEIENALNNLVNTASQRVHTK